LARGRNVALRITALIQIGLASVFLVACNATTSMTPRTGATPEASSGASLDSGGIAPTDAAEMTEMGDEAAQSPPPLVYSWDTEFSTFLSPPVEVRRLARDDCLADGYEIATVGTLALDGNIATATFICRGDFE
jgi:hypothetical protein